MGVDELEVTLTYEGGIDGKDDDRRNLLSRVFEVVVREGKPQRAISLLMYATRPEHEPLRWLGALVHTAGDRVLFFPGLYSTGRLVVRHRGTLAADRDFLIDHLTLDANRETWHLTGPRDSDEYQGGPTTEDLGGGVRTWFGMALKGEELLPKVRKQTVMRASVPTGDSRRRHGEFSRAVDAASDHIIRASARARDKFEFSFPHFTFFIGPPDFSVPERTERPFPRGYGQVDPELPTGNMPHPMTRHRIHLAEDLDVMIDATWLPGQLQRDISLNSGGSVDR